MVVYRSHRDDSGVYGVVNTSVANTSQELNPLLNDKMRCVVRDSFLIKQGKASSCLPECIQMQCYEYILEHVS